MKIFVISIDDKTLLSIFIMEENTIFQLEVSENT